MRLLSFVYELYMKINRIMREERGIAFGIGEISLLWRKCQTTDVLLSRKEYTDTCTIRQSCLSGSESAITYRAVGGFVLASCAVSLCQCPLPAVGVCSAA